MLFPTGRLFRQIGVLLAGIAFSQSLIAAYAEHHSPHHVSVAFGGADFDRKGAAFIGLEYEYQFTGPFALGGYYETTFGDIEIEAIGIAGALRPHAGWKLLAGLGVERKLADGKNKGLVKLGAGYEFHSGDYTIAPIVSVDLIEDFSRVIYYGLQVGRGF